MPPARPAPFAAQAREHLLDLLGPLVADAGYDLEAVSITAAGRRILVRVMVDGDAGIDLDAVAAVSRLVSDALDAGALGEPALTGSYVLEVSSPGVDRPLTESRHWRRAIGRLVKVAAGQRVVTGRVQAVADDAVTLDVRGAQRQIPWADLGPGKVQVEFNRPEEE